MNNGLKKLFLNERKSRGAIERAFMLAPFLTTDSITHPPGGSVTGGTLRFKLPGGLLL
jgi:hypothetical protein